MFIEILFKILLFKGGVLIYAEHCKLYHLQHRVLIFLAVRNDLCLKQKSGLNIKII